MIPLRSRESMVDSTQYGMPSVWMAGRITSMMTYSVQKTIVRTVRNSCAHMTNGFCWSAGMTGGP